MQSDPLDVWNRDGQPSQPTQSTQPVFQPTAQSAQQPTQPVFQPAAQPAEPVRQVQLTPQPFQSTQPVLQPAAQPNPIIATPAATSMPDFAAAANAADSKKKPNKTIIYSAAAAAAVILLVTGVFGTKWFLRAQAYSGAIVAIDSVKNVAEKKDMKLREASINDNTTADFFIKTGGAPNKTLFKDVKTPAEGLVKYDAVMKQLSNRRNAFGDKTVAEKIDSTKETYEKFRNHADASSKFLKIVSKYSKGMKHEWGDSQEKDKKSTKQAIEAVNNLNKEMSTFKSSDKDFDKAAKGLISDLHKIVAAMVKNSGADGNLSTALKEGSAGISPSLYESLARLGDEIKQMNDYFEETVSLRNQFVDSLADLRSTLASKK